MENSFGFNELLKHAAKAGAWFVLWLVGAPKGEQEPSLALNGHERFAFSWSKCSSSPPLGAVRVMMKQIESIVQTEPKRIQKKHPKA